MKKIKNSEMVSQEFNCFFERRDNEKDLHYKKLQEINFKAQKNQFEQDQINQELKDVYIIRGKITKLIVK